MMSKPTAEEPVVGVPYAAPYASQAPPPPQHPYAGPYANQAPPPQANPMYYHQPPPPPQYYHYMGQNPYQSGMIPPNAIYDDPKGVPLQQTMFRDTPAPFSCVYCGSSGLTNVKSKPSLAAVVGCMMPFMMGCCFLCPSMDCLWHKYHYCPSCAQKVADFKKSDPCLVVDAPRWFEPSYALPA